MIFSHWFQVELQNMDRGVYTGNYNSDIVGGPGGVAGNFFVFFIPYAY